MNEDFVCFEIAKKLKDKGYPQVEKNTLAMYDGDGCLSCLCPTFDINRYCYCFENFDKHGCVAPTISQVLKWLREEKEIMVFPVYSTNTSKWYCVAINADSLEQYKLSLSDSYEEAALAGIEYVIDNLI